jgi:hypothetical protein
MRHTAGKPLQSLAKVLGIPLAPPGSDGARWYRHCTETEWRQENGQRMAERGKNAQT